MQKHKILITGANGLLGRRAVRSFSKDHEVHAIVRRMPDQPVENVIYHAIDLGAEWRSEDLPNDIDAIFHLAQSSKFREFPNEAMDIFHVNIESTARLLDYASKNKVRKFIYASSGGVYGTGMHTFNENVPIVANNPLGYYLGSKMCGEILAQSYAPIMQVVILRFFFMYGPEQKRSMLLPRLIDNVKNGVPITLQGHDGIHINPIHVSDATNALMSVLAMEESSTLNIAGPDVCSIREIAEIAGRAIGKFPIFEVQDKEPQNLLADIEEIQKAGWSPQISLSEGIKELI
jgi:UDP-glucose 4-epimerase